MSNHFDLLYEISLDNFNVKLYKLAAELIEVSLVNINMLEPKLNIQQYARDIIELLQVQNGISKIEVFDKNNNLLTSSGLLIIEE